MEWEAINDYFKTQCFEKLVDHQTESFEDFIRNKIPLVVSSTELFVDTSSEDTP
jgi:CHASE1-domain containing sensor protein